MKNEVYVLNDLNYSKQMGVHERIKDYIKKHFKIKRGDKVAIKLNLVGPFLPEQAATTHPEVVRVVIEALLPYECEIILCEDLETEDTLKKTGVQSLLDTYQLTFYNLRDYGYVVKQVENVDYHYSSLILESDIVIQLPKFKTHMLTNFTGAIKNMYGCIKKAQRKALHINLDDDNFANIICSIYSIRKPDLVIMDAIMAMEGTGPSVGTPKYLGKIILGVDGVLIDYYAANLVGFCADDLQLIQTAFERELEISSKDEIHIIGSSMEEKALEFNKLPVYHGKSKIKYFNILKRSYKINYEICIKCGKCIENCPFGALTESEKRPVFSYKKCTLCTCCMELCPVNAINTSS